jgi:2-polyprenyl-3-methyl-5-hydroxy-6-metoxy-1,4-benzoquinol methylase
MFDLNDPSEFIICLEVAEHIETSLNDDIVDSLYKNLKPGGTLIFSAAHPGQGGVGHINCQTKEYWLEKFELRGLKRNLDAERNWEIYTEINQNQYMGWFMINKLFLYKPI